MGTLYLVATPIGNLEDVTLRALRVLGEVDVVLAEDTRRTRVLLDRHGIAARPRSLHAHNEASRQREVIACLAEGRDVALVSDAGTPLVSDPGERLVRAALDAGFTVSALPGASAALAALAVSGLPALPSVVLGFPPRKRGAACRFFEAWRGRGETLIVFESPRRLAGTLRLAREVLGNRPACVARELTKLHEEAVRGSLDELAVHFEDGARGEVTVVIAGAHELDDAPRDEDLDARIAELVEAGCSAKDVAAQLSAAGVPKREVYARAVAARRVLQRGRE